MRQSLKLLITALLLSFITGCGLIPNNLLTMDNELWREYKIVVDGVDIDISLPEESRERKSYSSNVDTSEVDREFYWLLRNQYDLRSSFSDYYHLTIMSVELTRQYCCSIQEIIQGRRNLPTTLKLVDGPKLVLINGKEWVYDKFILSDTSPMLDGKRLITYTQPFNDRLVLSISLGIRPPISKRSKVVEYREQALHRAVESIVVSKPE